MAWRSLGLLYAPTSSHPKLASHAANPLAVPMGGDAYRIFFSGRDAMNRSSVGAVDIDVVTRRILQHHEAPFFEHGPAGSFYEAGVSIGNCYEVDGTRYIGFMGWQNPPSGHWRGDIGRLVLRADLTLALDSPTPLMGVDAADPISLSYPWIMRAGECYRMWYGSTMAWDAGNNEMLHVIKHAHSADGNNWQRDGLAIPFALGEAQAFSRPTVLVDAHGYHAWFSYRPGDGTPYRIGYAHSADGNAWHRADAGFTPHGAWDNTMQCYPFVFEHAGARLMLYNGNDYGKTGFGLSVWE